MRWRDLPDSGPFPLPEPANTGPPIAPLGHRLACSFRMTEAGIDRSAGSNVGESCGTQRSDAISWTENSAHSQNHGTDKSAERKGVRLRGKPQFHRLANRRARSRIRSVNVNSHAGCQRVTSGYSGSVDEDQSYPRPVSDP